MNPKNSLKNHQDPGFEPKRPPTKAPRGGDIGRLIDCEIAEGFTLANLGHYPPNIPYPVGFACRCRPEKYLSYE